MTFCALCKKDISENLPEKSCCCDAKLYGMLLFSKEFSTNEILCSSEHIDVITSFVSLLRDFGVNEDDIQFSSGVRDASARITNKDATERILSDFGYSGDEMTLRINRENLVCSSCAQSFIAGCFLTGGTVTSPESGYHLEFTSYRKNLVDDLEQVLKNAGYPPLRSQRGYLKVLYYKNSSQIEDILAFMGAVESSMELMNTKILREIVNGVNRRTNCENANIDKSVNAAANDRADIELIYKKLGRDGLPDELGSLAELRLENPDLTIAELGELLEHKLTKSGVNHRLRRIRALAASLRESEA